MCSSTNYTVELYLLPSEGEEEVTVCASCVRAAGLVRWVGGSQGLGMSEYNYKNIGGSVFFTLS